MHRSLVLILAALAGLSPFSASAISYFKWDTVELPTASGATCGNGTPYRFFVNRTPFTTKTVVVFEGGGACWGQNGCRGKDAQGHAVLSAINYPGIPVDYMTNLLSGSATFNGLISPFTTRLDPLQAVRTQSWNIVYVPYCTGDFHGGNKVALYADADAANPLAYYHRGGINAEQMAKWLGAHFDQPEHLLVTGFSAGASGATINYGWLRLALKPKKSALLADSGPWFNVPRHATPDQAPSVSMHQQLRQAWGFDEPNGLVGKLQSLYPDTFNADNLGSINASVAKGFPQDRFSHIVFQQDNIFPAFLYTAFYPEIAAAPSGVVRDGLRHVKWRQELTPWVNTMGPLPNVGYYLPYQRDLFKSHTLTMVTFMSTAIDEVHIPNVNAVIDDLLLGNGTPIRAFEQSKNPQNSPTPGWFDSLMQPLYTLMGF